MSTEQPAEETFISHLVELRDRLLKASIGILIVTAVLMAWPGPTVLYDLLAQPLIDALP
jgi:sec-independent protein translocase protein TatC